LRLSLVQHNTSQYSSYNHKRPKHTADYRTSTAPATLACFLASLTGCDFQLETLQLGQFPLFGAIPLAEEEARRPFDLQVLI
jgi:hypothetical protein